jgi:hypothetical protein
VRLFSRLLVSLGLVALPAFCAPLALNGVNDWYGFYWNQVYTPPIGGFPSSFGSISSGSGTVYGAEGPFSNASHSSNVVYSAGSTTVLGISPLGGPDVATFTVGGSGATTLFLTDLGTNGDYFAVYDNGSLLGSTLKVASTGAYCGMDPVACSANALFSHGGFNVIAGDVIEIVAASTNFNGSGIGAFQLGGAGASSVPEPATLSLMVLGLGGMLLGARKRFS